MSALLSHRALNRATLARQLLLAREALPVAAAVARVAGVQAQLPRPAFVGLWARVAPFAWRDVLDALERRELLRATTMRGTLHLMATDDYVAWRGALQPLFSRIAQGMMKGRVTDVDTEAIVRHAREFFRTPATFDALRRELDARHPGAMTRIMAYVARLHLPLVQLPDPAHPWGWSGQADFGLADAWLGRAVDPTPAPADTLVRRYLAAFGPATIADARTWSGLAGLDATFERLRPELVTFRDPRGRELFDLPDAPRPGDDTPAPVRFLPEWDNLLLAHEDRTRVIAEAHRARLMTKNGLIRPTFLADGTVAGFWRTARKRKTATLVLEPFAALKKKTLRALEEEGEALLAFAEEDAGAREIRVDG